MQSKQTIVNGRIMHLIWYSLDELSFLLRDVVGEQSTAASSHVGQIIDMEMNGRKAKREDKIRKT
jgi:hypothetical protein